MPESLLISRSACILGLRLVWVLAHDFFGKILGPWGAGQDRGLRLRVDRSQGANPACIGVRGFTKIEREPSGRQGRQGFFPKAVKFGRPWSYYASFKLYDDRFFVLFDCDS